MRKALWTLPVFLLSLFCQGCIRDEEFFVLEEDVTQLENRLQKMETGAIKQTRSELSNVAQSQRNQTGTLEQLLSRVSNMERDLAALKREQQSLGERLDRLEVSQLKDKQAINQDLQEISRQSKEDLNEGLRKLSQEFNRAHADLSKAWEKRMADYSRSFEARVKKLDSEISNFYRELEKTIQGYSEGTYIVKPGENLSSIAQQLGVSVDELARVNQIQDPSKIRAGQELLIP